MKEIAARVVALAAVILCGLTPYLWQYLPSDFNDGVIALLGLVAVLTLRDGNAEGLGLCATPIQGWRFWCRIAGWLALLVGAALVLFWGAVWMTGWTIPIYRSDPRVLPTTLLFMCVYAPITEEIVFRSLLTVAVKPKLGEIGTIVCSGLVFAALHVARGIPSPENQIGGFLLAWAFLRSGTILVPLALHSGGNLIALVGQLAAWYAVP